MKLNETLTELCQYLNGINYSVFLRIYTLPTVRGQSVEQYITQTFPNATLHNPPMPATATDILEELENVLHRANDTAYEAADSKVLESPRFQELISQIRNHVLQATTNASELAWFALKSGHPAYPVHWSLSFLIVGSQETQIFIGSSSD